MRSTALVIAMFGLIVLQALVLSAIGAPYHLLVVVPLVVCVAMHLWMGHGDPDGAKLLATAQKAAAAQRQ